MTNTIHFAPDHLTPELKKLFEYLLVGETFIKDGNTYQYIGNDSNGNIAAILIDSEVKKIGTINIQQTWEGQLKVLIVLLRDGNKEGQQAAIKELQTMAQMADNYVSMTNFVGISFLWSVEQVIEIADRNGHTITADEAMIVLEDAKANYDPKYGMTEDMIAVYIEESIIDGREVTG